MRHGSILAFHSYSNCRSVSVKSTCIGVSKLSDVESEKSKYIPSRVSSSMPLVDSGTLLSVSWTTSSTSSSHTLHLSYDMCTQPGRRSRLFGAAKIKTFESDFDLPPSYLRPDSAQVSRHRDVRPTLRGENFDPPLHGLLYRVESVTPR